MNIKPHLKPLYPGGQLQANPVDSFLHEPPLTHGLDSQKLIGSHVWFRGPSRMM